MKNAPIILTIFLTLAASSPARADDPPKRYGLTDEAKTKRSIVLKKGECAKESLLCYDTKGQIELGVALRDRLACKGDLNTCQADLEAATVEPFTPWFENTWFHVALGIVVGAGIAIGAGAAL